MLREMWSLTTWTKSTISKTLVNSRRTTWWPLADMGGRVTSSFPGRPYRTCGVIVRVIPDRVIVRSMNDVVAHFAVRGHDHTRSPAQRPVGGTRRQIDLASICTLRGPRRGAV